MITRNVIPLASLVLVLGLGAAATACGGDAVEAETGSDVPTLPSTGDDGAAAGASDTDGDDSDTATFDNPGEAALAFSQCMRSEGVESFSDPEIVGDDEAVRAQIAEDVTTDPDFEAAQETCQPLLDQGGQFTPLDEEQQAELQEELLAFTQCMREHGIDFPDPVFDGGRVTMGGGPGAGFDPDDPAFAEAQEACVGEEGPVVFGTGPGPGPDGSEGSDDSPGSGGSGS